MTPDLTIPLPILSYPQPPLVPSSLRSPSEGVLSMNLDAEECFFKLWCLKEGEERNEFLDSIYRYLKTRYPSFFSYAIDDRLFAHILCADLIRDTSFEGDLPINSLTI